MFAEDNGSALWNVTFSGNKWLRYSAYKGAFLAMDDFAKSKPYDKADLIPSAVDGGTFDWAASPRFRKLYVDPEPAYHGLSFSAAFGAAAYALRLRVVLLRDLGAAVLAACAALLAPGGAP